MQLDIDSETFVNHHFEWKLASADPASIEFNWSKELIIYLPIKIFVIVKLPCFFHFKILRHAFYLVKWVLFHCAKWVLYKLRCLTISALNSTTDEAIFINNLSHVRISEVSSRPKFPNQQNPISMPFRWKNSIAETGRVLHSEQAL